MKKILKIFSFFVFSLCIGQANFAQNIAIDSLKIQKHIQYLASNELKGRFFGSDGEKKAADYIESQFNSINSKFSVIVQEFPFRVDEKQNTGKNVMFWVEGTKKPDEYIVVGAHYDHIGMGGIYSRKPDTVAVHPGADDNASGTAVLIECAKTMFKQKPERSVVFVAFSGEEVGLAGSKCFVETLPFRYPPMSKEDIKAMVNFDMVGHLDSVLTIAGTGTALQFDSLISATEHSNSFKIQRSAGGYGPSDHASFYAEKIPVLYFQTTIGDDYYHTPFDVWEKINHQGAAEIANYATQLILELAKSNQTITYQGGTGDKPMELSRGKMKVTLGIMPDHNSANGLKISSVREKQAADKAGLLKNDVIIEINGETIRDISSYMIEMQKFEKEQTVPFVIIRNNEKQTVMVSF